MCLAPCRRFAATMAFRRVSTQPLAFAWRGFASADECDSLIRAGEAAREYWRSYTSVHGIQSVRTAQFSSIAEYGNGKLYAKLDRSSSRTLDLVDRFDAAASSLMGLDAAKGESQLHCTPAWPDDEAALLNGLHVDTYNEPRRYATSLLYLRSVERGGERALRVPRLGVTLGSIRESIRESESGGRSGLRACNAGGRRRRTAPRCSRACMP